jgi:predicted GH43/DUF377 family glycosyl hydrolase
MTLTSRFDHAAVLAVVFGGIAFLPSSYAAHDGKTGWTQPIGHPVITCGQDLPGYVWNDPSVLKDDHGYDMWLSGGNPKHDPMNPSVSVFHAASPDGIGWTIDTSPVLTPGPKGSWDDHRIETPSVIKVGSTYHLYYSGCDKANGAGAEFNIGHATSLDGVHWTKDPANPIIARQDDMGKWGFYTVAEPGVVFDPGKHLFFLYYTSLTLRRGFVGDLAAMQGILLATSTDGSHFESYAGGEAVLTQTENYPVSKRYVGYSTPSALLDPEGVFHLFYDVFQYLKPSDHRQVAICHATSRDGMHFTETEPNLLANGGSTWYRWEIGSPTVIEDNGVFKMWFSGRRGRNDWLTESIGYAENDRPRD